MAPQLYFHRATHIVCPALPDRLGGHVSKLHIAQRKFEIEPTPGNGQRVAPQTEVIPSNNVFYTGSIISGTITTYVVINSAFCLRRILNLERLLWG